MSFESQYATFYYSDQKLKTCHLLATIYP